MNNVYSPNPTMMKIGSLTRIQSIMTRDDRLNQFIHNQEKSYIKDDIDDNIATNDIASLKPALRQSIHSFRSSSDCCSGEVEPPKYPRRRLNSIDMNDFEGDIEQLIETIESSSSLLESQTMSSTIEDQIESIHHHYHHTTRLSISPSPSTLIGMEIFIFHEHSDDDDDTTSIRVTIKQKYDSVPQSPRRKY